jgi:hypothetical protein
MKPLRLLQSVQVAAIVLPAQYMERPVRSLLVEIEPNGKVVPRLVV